MTGGGAPAFSADGIIMMIGTDPTNECGGWLTCCLRARTSLTMMADSRCLAYNIERLQEFLLLRRRAN